MFATPQPRTITQRTPIFHGPNGMLEPMPDRISHDEVPRRTDSPGMSAQKMSPLTSQATTPRTVITMTWSGVSAWNAASTSL
ncbi:MAG: hypothetical protein MUE82_00995 [Chloroflexi bacterium]|nr:hypothetical protein [Chloroflexota bacterium]